MIVESNGNSRIVKKTNSRPNSRILNSRLAPLVTTQQLAHPPLLQQCSSSSTGTHGGRANRHEKQNNNGTGGRETKVDKDITEPI